MHLLLHQLGALLQIGEQPAALRQAPQPLASQQLGEHPQQAPRPQPFRQPGQAAGQGIPVGRAGGGEAPGTPAQQGGGGQQPLARAAAGFRQGIEQALQGGGPFAFEHIALAHQPAGDAPFLQGAPQGVGLGVAAHQQTDVARLQGSLLAVLANLNAALQQIQCQRADLLGQGLLQLGFAGQLRPGGGGSGLRPQPQQLQRRLTRRKPQLQRLPLRLGDHGGHGQAGAHQPRGHQAVERGHQGPGGAEVVAHAADGGLPRQLPRRQVGVEIAATEAVDRLFGVTHDHQQMLAGFKVGGEGLSQCAPLNRVGVLEFIDQGRPVAAAQRLDQRDALGAGRARIKAPQQLSVADPPGSLPPAAQFPSPPVAEMGQHGFGGAIHQRGHRFQQRLLRQRHRWGFERLGDLREHTGMEVVGQPGVFVDLQLGVGAGIGLGGEPGTQLLNPFRSGFAGVGRCGAGPQRLPLLGAGTERLLQRFPPRRPQRLELLPDLAPEASELALQRRLGLPAVRQGRGRQRRIAFQLLEQAGEACRGHLGPFQPLQQVQRQGQHLAVPVVVDDLFGELGPFRFHLQLRAQARLQRLAPQVAVAEAVDRGDVGGIELFEGQQQPGPQLGHVGVGGPLLQPAGQHRVRGGAVGGGRLQCFKRLQSLLKPPADPVTQLRCRRFGEGHHQQLSHRQGLFFQVRLRDQAQHQVGQGKGFAGACTGFK